ncbi:MAG TPA: hypothetical protein VEN30_18460 [Paraburkholderia sp.]|nr:hypothetical protein [Paraburkholderia sp.]
MYEENLYWAFHMAAGAAGRAAAVGVRWFPATTREPHGVWLLSHPARRRMPATRAIRCIRHLTGDIQKCFKPELEIRQIIAIQSGSYSQIGNLSSISMVPHRLLPVHSELNISAKISETTKTFLN